jgi:polygalacturonase
MEHQVKPGKSIQAAIDAANEAGGGRVVLEPGVHPSTTLFMKSNVELHISAGAKIQGSDKAEDYPDFRDPGFDAVAPEKSRKCLIAAAHCENVAITGDGEINGAGPAFYDTNVPDGAFFAKPPHPRPRMIQFFNCRNVRFEGPSFIDSPGWTFWLIACENVKIHRITVTGNQQMINNDGIDIDDCRNVTVSDCVITTGDDCLILRAIRKGPEHHAVCENVVVTNCVLDSRCQAIRVGCPSDDTIRSCTFGNLVLRGSGNGININNPKRYLMQGCNGYLDLHDILFGNLVIESKRVPIWINVEEGVALRRIGGMTFSNIRIRSENPCRLEGSTETIIEDVRFSEVRCQKAPIIENCRRISLNQVEIDNA